MCGRGFGRNCDVSSSTEQMQDPYPNVARAGTKPRPGPIQAWEELGDATSTIPVNSSAAPAIVRTSFMRWLGGSGAGPAPNRGHHVVIGRLEVIGQRPIGT